ncbi:MAG: L,D-transpeptidase [Mucilaginibacter sp.]|nr:L,D-transpeptidase [Mucilaginibacter sp.]
MQLTFMTKLNPIKGLAVPSLIILLSALILTFQSCKKKRPEIANILFKKTHNKVFKDFTPEGFSEVFQKVLADKRAELKYPDLIKAYYDSTEYTPDFLLQHLFSGDLATADEYFMRANEHGLDSGMFQAEQLKTMIHTFTEKKSIKTIDEAYHDMAELEITAVNSLINYSNDLQYGVINPKTIYRRYFIATKEPDSTSASRVFHIGNMKAYLDSIQPKDPQYIALQNALKNSIAAPGRSPEETKRLLMVNLERLRWRNKPFQNKYVIVNIPDYSLNVIDSGRSVLSMKVCVGQGRNMDNANTLMAYNDTAKVDKPNEHETPLLNSLIHSVEVNPVWNIPNSIANKEIIVDAAKDRFYLSNKGIDVYKSGKLIDDPEDIDWSKVTKDNSDYEFKQKPGDDNSLGKIKFLFNNKSSVYLHDTPAKSAFLKKMRAVSHGCVRLGDPQGLALNLFGQGEKYETIATDMSADNPEPTTIYLPKKVPVYITYCTCWADENNQLQFRPDVYGLDIVLYDHLIKYLHPAS